MTVSSSHNTARTKKWAPHPSSLQDTFASKLLFLVSTKKRVYRKWLVSCHSAYSSSDRCWWPPTLCAKPSRPAALNTDKNLTGTTYADLSLDAVNHGIITAFFSSWCYLQLQCHQISYQSLESSEENSHHSVTETSMWPWHIFKRGKLNPKSL